MSRLRLFFREDSRVSVSKGRKHSHEVLLFFLSKGTVFVSGVDVSLTHRCTSF